MKKLKKFIGVIEKEVRFDLIFPSVYCAVALSLLWNPLNNLIDPHGIGFGESAGDFTRQFGQALVYGIDIGKRVLNFKFYGFAYLPLLFLITWGGLCLLFRKHEIDKEGLSFLTRLTAAACPALAVVLVTQLNNSIYSLFSPVSYGAVVSVLMYLRFGADRLPLKQFKWAFFTAIVMEFFAIRIMYVVNSTLFSSYPQYTVMSLVSYLTVLAGLCMLGARFSRNPHCESLCAAATPLYVSPIFVSLFLELSNILNQYGIFIGHKTAISIGIMAVSILVGISWFYVKGIHITSDTINYTRWQYPLLILSLTVLLVQPPQQIIVGGIELFESSNAGSDVYAFLTAGEIPLVENLNVHMILEELGSILYGLCNQDALGAIWFCYPLTSAFVYVILYCFFAVLTDSESSVLLTLFFPTQSILWLIQPAYGFLYALLTMVTGVLAAKHGSKRFVILFVFSCMLLCLHHADIGFSCGIASVLAVTVSFLLHKRIKSLRFLWITGICTGATFCGTYMILCMLRGISPLARILEFVSIMQSTVSWAYRNVANSYDLKYYICYFFVPLGTVICTLGVLFHRIKGEVLDHFLLISIMIALTYLFNFSRGIVRHNLVENSYIYVIGWGVLGIIFDLWVINGCKAIRLPLFLCGFLLCQCILTGDITSGGTLLQGSINQQLQAMQYQPNMEKIDRVVISDELRAVYEPLKTVFDATLEPD